MIQPVTPALTIHEASLAYGDVRVLRGLSLTLQPGEILGLLGPNGAGKTSLIRAISGRQSLSHGSISWAYKGNVHDVIGVVPQEIALYDDLTVRQNLQAFGQLQGLGGRQLRERIASALAWSDLHARSGSLVASLSGGMQRRLNIACSVLHKPKILLLDEPTVGVDPQSRERIYQMLDELVEQGTAVLLTTHHLEEAEQRCDRMAIIDSGRIMASGTFDELLERTIGNRQRICIRFSSRPGSLPASLNLDETGLEASGLFADARTELPRLLFALQNSNAVIEHLKVNEPTLQEVFLHMTGKELRE